MSVFHDEIEIEDMEYDDETETYHYPCPCGDRFEITKVKKTVCHSYFSFLNLKYYIESLLFFYFIYIYCLIAIRRCRQIVVLILSFLYKRVNY